MPQLSVIVPVHNVERYLHRCVDSILNQTFADFELILIDDGSPDKSGEICDDFALKDNRIKVIHKANEGVSSARNAGMDKATGEYIAFIDSDDHIDPNFLKIMLEKAVSTDADMVMCSYLQTSMGISATQHHPFGNSVLDGKNEITEKLIKSVIYVKDTNGLFSPCNKLFRTGIINRVNLRMDKTMSFGEDMLFVLSYIDLCEKISFINDPLYYYNQSESGLFNKYRPSFLNDIMKCYVNLKARADRLCLPEAYLPLSLKYRYYIERHIKTGIKIEKHKFGFVLSVYRNKEVRDVFYQIVSHREEVLKSDCWNNYELRLPKLISRGLLISATIYSVYQYDDNNLLRKIMKLFRKN
ncbi:MAG: glycosyltransferase family 2 protein [Clostridia bacterium]|nr:glycosyltransferase family 2 protein [Clostridia bacterium]